VVGKGSERFWQRQSVWTVVREIENDSLFLDLAAIEIAKYLDPCNANITPQIPFQGASFGYCELCAKLCHPSSHTPLDFEP
jgi:hypothetical protein